jgi:hypothetical protein
LGELWENLGIPLKDEKKYSTYTGGKDIGWISSWRK